MRPRLSDVNQAEAFWEVGREPGRQVVSLGVAVTLTAVSIDVLLVGRLTLFFDLCFMVLCLGLAALVRRRDFYLVALLPRLFIRFVQHHPGYRFQPVRKPAHHTRTGIGPET